MWIDDTSVFEWVEIERTTLDECKTPEEKINFYVNEIKFIIQQIQDWVELTSCKCSYMPLRWTVEMAMSWEIWEKYRLVKYWDEDTINKLASYITRNS